MVKLGKKLGATAKTESWVFYRQNKSSIVHLFTVVLNSHYVLLHDILGLWVILLSLKHSVRPIAGIKHWEWFCISPPLCAQLWVSFWIRPFCSSTCVEFWRAFQRYMVFSPAIIVKHTYMTLSTDFYPGHIVKLVLLLLPFLSLVCCLWIGYPMSYLATRKQVTES